MELKWLDDYIALIETGSFSAAAQRRHISQPAFSRRIQMLEAWLGVTLVDRTRKPLQLTAVALESQATFRGLATRIYEFRALLKSEALDSAGLTIVAQHTLAAAYVPTFLEQLRQMGLDQNCRIRSDNRNDSVAMLMRGQADMLITYETAQTSCAIPAAMATRQLLGTDALQLVASPALHAKLRRLPEGAELPMLCFPPESFLGQVVRAKALPALMHRQQVVVRCVSEFAMGLRELALVGQGAAWLPGVLIAEDLKQGRLLPLQKLGESVPMEIVLYMAIKSGAKGADMAAQFELLGKQTGADSHQQQFSQVEQGLSTRAKRT